MGFNYLFADVIVMPECTFERKVFYFKCHAFQATPSLKGVMFNVDYAHGKLEWKDRPTTFGAQLRNLNIMNEISFSIGRILFTFKGSTQSHTFFKVFHDGDWEFYLQRFEVLQKEHLRNIKSSEDCRWRSPPWVSNGDIQNFRKLIFDVDLACLINHSTLQYFTGIHLVILRKFHYIYLANHNNAQRL